MGVGALPPVGVAAAAGGGATRVDTVAKSKKAKQRARKQQAHQARATKHAQASAEKEHHHLPHSGTPANTEYLHERHIEDLVDFGEFRRARGPLPVVIATIVGLLFALGIVAWVLLF